MKLAEALILRADLQKKIQQLNSRISNNIIGQEGDSPAEDPNALYLELEAIVDQYVELVGRINKTNNESKFEDDMKVVDALAYREGLIEKRKVLSDMVESASQRRDRYSNSEIRYIKFIDVGQKQEELDKLSKEWRQLDTKIQELNWTIDLI